MVFVLLGEVFLLCFLVQSSLKFCYILIVLFVVSQVSGET